MKRQRVRQSWLTFLFVGYQLANILRFDRGNQSRMTQVTLALFALARKNMPLVPLITFDLSGSGHAKSFRGGSIGFDFRHFLLL